LVYLTPNSDLGLSKLACSILHYDIIGYVYEDAIKNIAKLGYEGVELHLPPPPHKKEKAPVRRLLKRLGLEPATVNCQRWDWAHDNPERVKGTMEAFKDTVLLAEYLNAKRVLTESGSIPKGMNPNKAFKMAAENVAAACDYARSHGIETVLLECVPPPFNYIVDNSEKFLEFRKVGGAANLYPNVDASNYLMGGDDPSKVLKKYGSLVRGIHIKDGTKKGGHWTPIGEGGVNWINFLRAAKQIGYGDWLVAEYEGSLTGKYYVDPEKASRDTIRYLRKIMQKL
jgi:sugar phosphate isomerase/epimerase